MKYFFKIVIAIDIFIILTFVKFALLISDGRGKANLILEKHTIPFSTNTYAVFKNQIKVFCQNW